MSENMQSDYVTFWKDRDYERDHKTQYFTVMTKREFPSEEIGHIKWYPAWRRYVFCSDSETLYDAQCLSDIGKFMGILMQERKNPIPKQED